MIPYVARGTQRKPSSPRPHSPLKQQRLLRGWSQQDAVNALYPLCVADGHPEVGLSSDHISRWENGRNRPSPVYQKHLCTLYGLTADHLGFMESQEVPA